MSYFSATTFPEISALTARGIRNVKTLPNFKKKNRPTCTPGPQSLRNPFHVIFPGGHFSLRATLLAVLARRSCCLFISDKTFWPDFDKSERTPASWFLLQGNRFTRNEWKFSLLCPGSDFFFLREAKALVSFKVNCALISSMNNKLLNSRHSLKEHFFCDEKVLTFLLLKIHLIKTFFRPTMRKTPERHSGKL